MMEHLLLSKFIAENVVKQGPGAHKSYLSSAAAGTPVGPRAITQDPFNADSVRTDVACGGFGSVVEIAATVCSQLFGVAFVTTSLELDATAMNTAAAGMPAGGWTNTFWKTALFAQKGAAPAWSVENLVLVDLSFQVAHNVVATFTADLTIWYFAGASGPVKQVPGASGLGTSGTPSANQGPGSDTSTPVQRHYPCPTPISFEITCPYEPQKDATARQANVVANVSNGTIQVRNANDEIAQIVQKGGLGPNASTLNKLLSIPDVYIVPTVAPAGPYVAGGVPTEFDRFDLTAQHVDDPAVNGRQAMAVALDIKPGAMGSAADIAHCIGDADFGVISDEATIARTLKYRFRLGQFFTTFPLSGSTQLQASGQPVQTATIVGTEALNTLDVVSIEIEANSNDNVVKLSGQATGTATGLTLSGQTFHPGSQGIDPSLWAPTQFTWIFDFKIGLEPQWSSVPLVASFEKFSYENATRYMARPFTNDYDPNMTYARTSAVTKQLYFLGNFPNGV